MKVGILSDTHGFIHPRILSFFREVDEVWHAGDIGNPETLLALEQVKPVRAVYGNIDGRDVRIRCQETLFFPCGQVQVLMTHMGGYPGRYDQKFKELILDKHPGLVVCGHSHILKVMYDQKHRLLFVNPGAAGKFGLHQSYTAIRMVVEGKGFRDLEVLDIPR